MTLQSDLRWKTHFTSLEKKLRRIIGLLSKIRHYVNKFVLRTIYYSIFNSHLIYGCKVLSQNQNSVLIQRLQKFQEKAVRLINFETNPSVVGQLFKEVYTLFNQSHVYNTRGSTNQMLVVLQLKTTHYGEHSFKSRSIFFPFFMSIYNVHLEIFNSSINKMFTH